MKKQKQNKQTKTGQKHQAENLETAAWKTSGLFQYFFPASILHDTTSP